MATHNRSINQLINISLQFAQKSLNTTTDLDEVAKMSLIPGEKSQIKQLATNATSTFHKVIIYGMQFCHVHVQLLIFLL